MRRNGIVRSWAPGSSFGFILLAGHRSGVFVHLSDVDPMQELRAGEVVSFDLSYDHQGRTKAINVQREGNAGTRV